MPNVGNSEREYNERLRQQQEEALKRKLAEAQAKQAMNAANPAKPEEAPKTFTDKIQDNFSKLESQRTPVTPYQQINYDFKAPQQEEFKPVDNSMSDAMNAKFNLLEKKGIAQSRQQTGMEQDVISRRMAAMGSLGSGTNIKLQQQALREGANREQGVRESVGAMRLEDQANREQQAKAMNFQRQERISGQNFAANQAQAERDWNKLANTDQRNWTSNQAEVDRAFKDRMFNREYARQIEVDMQNMKMAEEAIRQNSQGMLDELGESFLGKEGYEKYGWVINPLELPKKIGINI